MCTLGNFAALKLYYLHFKLISTNTKPLSSFKIKSAKAESSNYPWQKNGQKAKDIYAFFTCAHYCPGFFVTYY